MDASFRRITKSYQPLLRALVSQRWIEIKNRVSSNDVMANIWRDRYKKILQKSAQTLGRAVLEGSKDIDVMIGL